MKISTLNKNEKVEEGVGIQKFASDVHTGLLASPKRISAKYFYDKKGSELFQKITEHIDYYPTRVETEILNDIKQVLPTIIGEKEIDIIELGAGDGHKSKIIIKGFLREDIRVNYYPIDISEKAMTQLKTTIKPRDNLTIHGIVGEYNEGLNFVNKKSKNKKLVLFLGSNIGNFNRVENKAFLNNLNKSLNKKDHVLIGYDLKKDIKTLNQAYNDSGGLTKEFNLNLLKRINKELGGNFDSNKFDHYGVYNPILGAMESHLISKEEQLIYIKELTQTIHFEAHEPLHLEYSFKFTEKDIIKLSKQTGYEVINNFTDTKKYFIDSLWQVI
ncbi:hypothetical protein DID80_08045 [Candidatus Marinamargulisbacteria bacterium SCGC AAA071-K20]|nr:hypothetical protein DID80_08045 [Candidatus Marinamargulisbacteria bacterium SCGC AAA071-K20]